MEARFYVNRTMGAPGTRRYPPVPAAGLMTPNMVMAPPGGAFVLPPAGHGRHYCVCDVVWVLALVAGSHCWRSVVDYGLAGDKVDEWG